MFNIKRILFRAPMQRTLLQRALSGLPLPSPKPHDESVRVDALRGLPPNVADAARALCERLAAAGAPCAIIGAVACNAYGHRRSTSDVEVLVNAKDSTIVRTALVGNGWAGRFPGARKMLRDTVHGVDVDVLHSGEFPGDGLPKSVAFPELIPKSDLVELIDGACVISLPRLIELKLASGTSAPASRRKDLADVYALISANGLPRSYATELHVSMRPAFCKIWDEWHKSFVAGASSANP